MTACLVSPFSWYHHWVWVFPLAIVVLISVNQALGKRLRGVIGDRGEGGGGVALLQRRQGRHRRGVLAGDLGVQIGHVRERRGGVLLELAQLFQQLGFGGGGG